MQSSQSVEQLSSTTVSSEGHDVGAMGSSSFFDDEMEAAPEHEWEKARSWLSSRSNTRPWKQWQRSMTWDKFRQELAQRLRPGKYVGGGGSYTCGPTAMIEMFRMIDPLSFTKAAYNLYTTGAFRGKGESLLASAPRKRVSRKLRKAGFSRLSSLMVHSLRSSGSAWWRRLVLPFGSESKDLLLLETGSTFPPEMRRWARRLTGWKSKNIRVKRKKKRLEKFVKDWNANYDRDQRQAILLTGSGSSMHYVVLDSKIEPYSHTSKLRFHYISYGRRETKTVTIEDFASWTRNVFLFEK